MSDVCRKLGISEQGSYRWRKAYGGLKRDQARQFKELERENARLRKAVSELTPDKMILNEALSGKILSTARRGKTVCFMSDAVLDEFRASCLPCHRSAPSSTQRLPKARPR